MSSGPISRRLDAPLMLRSRRDVLLPIVAWGSSVSSLAVIAALALGFPAGTVVVGTALTLMLVGWVVLQRRPGATLWLSRASLRDGRLSGRIEIDRIEEVWRIVVRYRDERIEYPVAAAARGRTSVLFLDVPFAASAGESMRIDVRTPNVVCARFRLRLTARP